jgi:hypothetical protein
MTCIVGIEHEGKVTLAADQLASSRVSKSVRRDEKLVKIGDQLVLAFTKSYRQGQLLRWRLPNELPDIQLVDSIGGGEDAERRERWMNTTFIDAVRKVFEKAGARARHNEVEEGGIFLAGFGDRLWVVESDNQVASPAAGWDSHGSGWGPAAGALSATAGMRLRPETRLDLAVRAACETVPSCGLGPDGEVPMISTKGVATP